MIACSLFAINALSMQILSCSLVSTTNRRLELQQEKMPQNHIIDYETQEKQQQRPRK
jgi:hypothetical protein